MGWSLGGSGQGMGVRSGAAVAAPALGRPVVLPRDPAAGRSGTPWVLAALGVLLGVVAVTLKTRDGSHSVADTALSASGGLLFLVAGMVAHLRRPANRTGLLMVLVGIAVFAEDLQLAHTPVLYTIGSLCSLASAPFSVLLVLAFPWGRLPSRPARVLTTATFAVVALTSVLGAMFWDWSLRYDKPANLLLVTDWPRAGPLLRETVDAVGVLVAAGVVASLAHRLWRGGRDLRAPLTPALLIAIVASGATALTSAVGDGSPLRAPLTYTSRVAFCLWPLAFLSGALLWRPGRTAIADLLVAVGNPVGAAELRELLATALRDPTLRLARWDGGRFVDADGVTVETGDPDRTVITLADGSGRPVGLLLRRVPPWEDTRLTDAVATLVALVLDNQRLAAAAADRLAEVHASRARLVTLADEERRRMERDLHDGAQQRLVVAAVGIERARRALGPDADPALAARLGAAADDLTAAIGQLREIARGIHPALLTQAGLAAAVEDLVQRTPLPVTLTLPPLPRLPAPVEATAYFVTAEALTNAVKHAAAGQVDVHFGMDGDRLRVEVADDGVGGARLTPGSGLAGLRDRVRALDGELTIHSGPGSRITAWIPVG
jgi:signal transduction histidine kinase